MIKLIKFINSFLNEKLWTAYYNFVLRESIYLDMFFNRDKIIIATINFYKNPMYKNFYKLNEFLYTDKICSAKKLSYKRIVNELWDSPGKESWIWYFQNKFSNDGKLITNEKKINSFIKFAYYFINKYASFLKEGNCSQYLYEYENYVSLIRIFKSGKFNDKSLDSNRGNNLK